MLTKTMILIAAFGVFSSVMPGADAPVTPVITDAEANEFLIADSDIRDMQTDWEAAQNRRNKAGAKLIAVCGEKFAVTKDAQTHKFICVLKPAAK